MAARDKRESANKPNRVPVGGLRDIMTVYNKDPDFVYRWVNDSAEGGSRIARFLRGGYEFARSETDAGEYVIGEEAVYKTKNGDSIVRLYVGVDRANNPLYSYLMRIRKEYYEEDQAAKEADLREMEDQIYRTGTQNGDDFDQYGEVKISRD